MTTEATARVRARIYARKRRRRWHARTGPVEARHMDTARAQLDGEERTVAALLALPEQMRAVFMLHRCEAWPCSRIAVHLRIRLPDVMEAMTGALYALDTAREKQGCACAACIAATVREALTDAAAIRAELAAVWAWPGQSTVCA